MAEFLNGYVRLHRKSLDTFHGDGIAFSIFCHLLLKANWEDGKKTLRKQKVLLKRGQTVCSQRQIGLRHGWHKTTVERAIKRLVDWDVIETEASHCGTIVTIKNYNKYQSDETVDKPPKNQKRASTVATGVASTVATGVAYSEEVKKEKKKKERETTWPDNHLYAKIFTNLNRIDAYREIFDFPEDEKTVLRHIERYSLSASELEQISYELAEWSNHPKNKIISPRGKLNTFCKSVADRRKKNIGPTYNQLTLEEY